ncbi:hypothetical protein ACFP1Z_19160 [Streptomyces gamaensis]|uniref:Uncharacterized protein n=1 Tax=Streptomyces gamaensis TaxID=1763542 RepID=A0ABW0Z3E7_9ACTN
MTPSRERTAGLPGQPLRAAASGDEDRTHATIADQAVPIRIVRAAPLAPEQLPLAGRRAGTSAHRGSEPDVPDDGHGTAAARPADPITDANPRPPEGRGLHPRKATEPHDGTSPPTRTPAGEPSPVRIDRSPGDPRNTAWHDQQLLAAPALNDPAAPVPAQAEERPTRPAAEAAGERSTDAPAQGKASRLPVGPAAVPTRKPSSDTPAHGNAVLPQAHTLQHSDPTAPVPARAEERPAPPTVEAARERSVDAPAQDRAALPRVYTPAHKSGQADQRPVGPADGNAARPQAHAPQHADSAAAVPARAEERPTSPAVEATVDRSLDAPTQDKAASLRTHTPAHHDPAAPIPGQAAPHPTHPAVAPTRKPSVDAPANGNATPPPAHISAHNDPAAPSRQRTTDAPATGHAVPLQLHGPAQPAPEHLPLAERPRHHRADPSHSPAGDPQDGLTHPPANSDPAPHCQAPAPAAEVRPRPDRSADAPSLTHGETATTREPGLSGGRMPRERDHADTGQDRTTPAPHGPSAEHSDRHPVAPITRKSDDAGTDTGVGADAVADADAGQRPTAPRHYEPSAPDTGRLPIAPASPTSGRADTATTEPPALPAPRARTRRTTAAPQQTTNRSANTAGPHPRPRHPFAGRQSSGTPATGAAAPISLSTPEAVEHRPLGAMPLRAPGSQSPARHPGDGGPEEFHAPAPAPAPVREPGTAHHHPAVPGPRTLPTSPAETRTSLRTGPVAAEPSPLTSTQPLTLHDPTHHDAAHPAEQHLGTGPLPTAHLSFPEAPSHPRRALAPLPGPRSAAAHHPQTESAAPLRPASPPQVAPGHAVFRRIAAHAPEPGGLRADTPTGALTGTVESAVPTTGWGIPQAVLLKESQDIMRNGGTGRAR